MIIESLKTGVALITGGIVVVSSIAALAVRVEQKAPLEALTATQLSVAVQSYQIMDLKEQLDRIEDKLDKVLEEERAEK